MKNEIAALITTILQDLGISDPRVEVTVPEDPAHGDYTTNIAMTLVKTLKKPPMEIALEVKEKLKAQSAKRKAKTPHQNIFKNRQTASAKLAQLDQLQAIDRVEVVPPGFLNVFLSEASLSSELVELLKSAETDGTINFAKLRSNPASPAGREVTKHRIMVEFAHPNTHKAFHIGHLRNITTGESIVRLLESQGHTVIRANYQGDVGMHIAKCLYVLLSQPRRVRPFEAKQRVEFLGKAYAAGSKAFEEDPAAKEEIGEINKKIYAKDPTVYPLYKETRQWSLDYFDAIYKRVGSRFDRYYFESEVYEPGKELVLEGLRKGVFEESGGAVIFPGKKYGLHNRVFVTGEGNATYEGKELALATMETTEHGKLDRIVHVVGPEQASFFTVTFKAEELLGIVKPGVQHHLVYGWVKLKHGKMSSRSGNVVLGEWLLDESKKAIYSILERNKSKYTKQEQEAIAEKAAVAAVKYAFLKVSTQQEIAFDMDTSVSFDGDSGPYLLYTYARCKSVVRKAQSVKRKAQSDWSLNPEERIVLRLLTNFPDVVAQAAETFSPATLCTYLFRLAQAFNLFYAKHQILGSGVPLFAFRLSLTSATAHILKHGLYLLGIETLERM